MVNVGLYVHLEAKAGKEKDVENFLRHALPLVQQEPATTVWFAIRMGPSTFGIFDAFPNEAGREAHLSGSVAAALMANASELLAQPPKIEKIDVLASKLPAGMKQVAQDGREEQIPMQVGSELRIRNTGELVVDNPEIELSTDRRAADAVLTYKFDRKAEEHILRLLVPVADHQHVRTHRPGD